MKSKLIFECWVCNAATNPEWMDEVGFTLLVPYHPFHADCAHCGSTLFGKWEHDASLTTATHETYIWKTAI